MIQLIKKITKQFVLGDFNKKKMYLSALRWSIVVRFCMFFLPFKVYKGLLGKMQIVACGEYTGEQLVEAKKIRNIVMSVCNNTPWESKCLVQAISCKKMLQKKGIQTTLFLGVDPNFKTSKMEAHAWLKMGDYILTGKQGYERFKVVNFYS